MFCKYCSRTLLRQQSDYNVGRKVNKRSISTDYLCGSNHSSYTSRIGAGDSAIRTRATFSASDDRYSNRNLIFNRPYTGQSFSTSTRYQDSKTKEKEKGKEQQSTSNLTTPPSSYSTIDGSPSPNSNQLLTEQLQSQKLNHDELLKKRFFMAQSQNRSIEQNPNGSGSGNRSRVGMDQKDVKEKAKSRLDKNLQVKGNGKFGGVKGKEKSEASPSPDSSPPLKESFDSNLARVRTTGESDNVQNGTVLLGSELKAEGRAEDFPVSGLGAGAATSTVSTSSSSAPISNQSSLGGKKDSFSGPNSESKPRSDSITAAGRRAGTSTASSNPSSSGSAPSPGAASNPGPGSSSPASPPVATELPVPNPDVPTSRPPRMDHPFNTRDFVQRLERGGWVNGWTNSPERNDLDFDSKVGASHTQGMSEPKKEVEGEASRQMQIMLAHKHDPAEAVMEAVRYLLISRGEATIERCLNKGDLENEAYLFSAALSELRTELQIRARNDATALRSITTLLQREVDSLSQRMSEDIAGLKHDIQVDMNNRKAESKEEANNVDQEIQDLNNRFTISLSDLKTEIEQNIKWDATRRALALVFGITAIIVATLSLADYLTREAKRNSNAASSPEEGGTEKDDEDKPKTAEELGLVPKYETDGTRFV